LPRIVATSAFAKPKDELQREHLLLLVRELLDQLEHALATERLHRLELRGVLLRADRLRHLLLGLHAPAGAEEVHRQVVRDRKSHAENGAAWKRKRPIDSSMRRKVCVVRSSASCRLPTVMWR
jgi:hypothetical protein